jgi:hypothetical protein
MDLSHETKLTSSWISNLWTSYQNDSMAICGIKYFFARANFIRLISKISNYANGGAKVKIDHGWMEQPAEASD